MIDVRLLSVQATVAHVETIRLILSSPTHDGMPQAKRARRVKPSPAGLVAHTNGKAYRRQHCLLSPKNNCGAGYMGHPSRQIQN